jgi:hypothetical protein
MDDAKKFNEAEIVIALLLVTFESVFKFVADIVFAVPVIGQIIFGFSELYTVITSAIILFWFVFKLGTFGYVGIMTVAGGALDFLGIPVGLATGTIAAIFLTNHPKIAKVEELAVGAAAVVATGGAAAAAEGAAAGAGAGAAAAAEAGAAAAEVGATAAEAGGLGAAAAEGAAGAESAAGAAEGAEAPGAAIKPEALGGQSELLGQGGRLQEELLERTPGAEVPGAEPTTKPAEEPGKAEEPAQKESESTKRMREAFEKAQKVREQMEKLKPPPQEEEDNQEGGAGDGGVEDENYLSDKAA